MITLIKITYFVRRKYIKVNESNFCLLFVMILLLVYEVQEHSCPYNRYPKKFNSSIIAQKVHYFM